MPDLASIGAALSSLKLAGEIAKTMIGLRDAQAFNAKLIEFQTAIMDAQSSALTAQQESAVLVERIRALEAEVASFKNWEAEKQRYQLEMFPPGILIPVLKPIMANGEPPHRICPTCYAREKKSFLQKTGTSNGQESLICHECKTQLHVGNYVPEPPHSAMPRRRY